MNRFATAMRRMEVQVPASGIYDFTWAIERAGVETERVVLVDVGGGQGQALVAIKEEFERLPMGRCVLQDRKEVIEAMEKEGSEGLREVRKGVVDFFEGQPVKGEFFYPPFFFFFGYVA